MVIFDKLFGLPKVEKLEAKKDVEGLIEALKHKNEDVRWGAAKALGKIGDARVVEPLIQALKDKDEGVRGHVADALERIGEPAAEQLTQALKDKASDRMKAAMVLDKLGWKPRNDAEKVHYLIARRELHELAKLGEPAVEPLIQALKDEDHVVRSEAAWTLGKIGDARAVKPLIQALQDRRLIVLTEAAKALAQIGDAIARGIAIEHLIQVLEVEDSTAISMVCITLTAIGEPAVEPLIQVLKDENRSAQFRWGAATALGEIGDARAVEPLIQALKDENESVGVTAKRALEKLNRFEEAEKPEAQKKIMVCRKCGKEVEYDEKLQACPHCMTYYPGWVMVMPVTKDPRAQKHKKKAGDYYSQGEKRKAISEFKKAAEIDQTDPTIFNNIGAIYGELGDYDEALKYLRKALEINPDLGPAKRQLKRIQEIVDKESVPSGKT